MTIGGTFLSSWCWRTALLSGFLSLHMMFSAAQGDVLRGNAALPEVASDPSGSSSTSSSGSGPSPFSSSGSASGADSSPGSSSGQLSGGGGGEGMSSSLYVLAKPLVRPRRGLSGASHWSTASKHHQREELLGVGEGLPTLTASRANRRGPLDFTDDTWGLTPPISPDGSLLLSSPLSPPPRHLRSRPEGGVSFLDSSSTRLLRSQEHQHARAQELQGGDPTSWTLSDFYDYLSPDYSTTEAYPDDDDDLDDDGPTEGGMADENLRSTSTTAGISDRRAQLPGGILSGDGGATGLADASSSGCNYGYVRSNGTCRSPCEVFTNYCLNGGQCYEVPGVGAFCRCNIQEYVWNKGSRCEAIITDFQVLCLLVGGASLTALLLFMIVVFFAKRLHTLRQENTRLRRRSKYRPQSDPHDNFSVSTLAEGHQANVRNVCDSSPSKLSHARHLAYYENVGWQKPVNRFTWECKAKEEAYCPQEDAGKEEEPMKEEEPIKSPPLDDNEKSPPPDDPVKFSPPNEEEPLTIQNSISPSLDNGKAPPDDGEDEDDDNDIIDPAAEEGLTIDLELLLPQEAKMHPPSSPPLEYDVFLYKLPSSSDPQATSGRSDATQGSMPNLLHQGQDPQAPRGRHPATQGSMPTLLHQGQRDESGCQPSATSRSLPQLFNAGPLPHLGQSQPASQLHVGQKRAMEP